MTTRGLSERHSKSSWRESRIELAISLEFKLCSTHQHPYTCIYSVFKFLQRIFKFSHPPEPPLSAPEDPYLDESNQIETVLRPCLISPNIQSLLPIAKVESIVAADSCYTVRLTFLANLTSSPLAPESVSGRCWLLCFDSLLLPLNLPPSAASAILPLSGRRSRRAKAQSVNQRVGLAN